MTFEEWWESVPDPYTPEILAKMAWDAATKAEREACANIAESFIWYEHDDCADDGANEFIAKIIRMRSNAELTGARRRCARPG